jgi:hypothetical protein
VRPHPVLLSSCAFADTDGLPTCSLMWPAIIFGCLQMTHDTLGRNSTRCVATLWAGSDCMLLLTGRTLCSFPQDDHRGASRIPCSAQSFAEAAAPPLTLSLSFSAFQKSMRDRWYVASPLLGLRAQTTDLRSESPAHGTSTPSSRPSTTSGVGATGASPTRLGASISASRDSSSFSRSSLPLTHISLKS